MGLFDTFALLKEAASTVSDYVKLSTASDKLMAEVFVVLDEAYAEGKLSPELKAAYDNYLKAENETLKLEEWLSCESDRSKKDEIEKRMNAAKENEEKVRAVLFPILDADTTLPADVQAKIDEALAGYKAGDDMTNNLAEKFKKDK